MDIRIPDIDDQEVPMELYGKQLLEWLAKAIDSRDIRIKGIKKRIEELALECTRLEDRQDVDRERVLSLLNELGVKKHNIPGIGTFSAVTRAKKVAVSDSAKLVEWARIYRPDLVDIRVSLKAKEAKEYAETYLKETGEVLEGFALEPEYTSLQWRR